MVSIDIGQTAVSFVAGGGGAALVTYWLQGRRAKRDLAVKLTYDFSSVESHKLREMFWSLPVHDLQTFADVDGMTSAEQKTAFRFVLSFYVQAAGLMSEGQIDRKLFFRLSQRWAKEILDRHLMRWAQQDTSPHYEVQRAAIKGIHGYWSRWNQRARWFRD